MSALALVMHRQGSVTEADIDAVMSANFCRCGTYPRIRRAIQRTAEWMKLRFKAQALRRKPMYNVDHTMDRRSFLKLLGMSSGALLIGANATGLCRFEITGP